MGRTVFSTIKRHVAIETDLSMEVETSCFAHNLAVFYKLTALLWRVNLSGVSCIGMDSGAPLREGYLHIGYIQKLRCSKT